MDRLIFSKPATYLSGDDFLCHPIWEWDSEEGLDGNWDESFVRPADIRTIPRDGGARQYLVAANALLKSRVELPACVAVSVEAGRLRFDPLFVFLGERQLEWMSDESERVLSGATNYPHNRPIRWQLQALIDGERQRRRGRVFRYAVYCYSFVVLPFLIAQIVNEALDFV